MDIHDQITSLIEQAKALPNSLARNKVVSFLENSRVWAKELEPSKNTEAPKAECICPAGGIRRDCPAALHH